MGRKLKYKDVVKKGAPQSNKKGKKGNKNGFRKTYNLHTIKESFKRKPNYNNVQKSKKPKFERQEVQERNEVVEEFSEESDEESVEDPLKQLREAFGINTTSVVTDSETESEGEEADENVENDTEDSDDGSSEDIDSDAELVSEQESSNLNAELDQEENDADSLQDPFVKHITYELHPKLLDVLESPFALREIKTVNWTYLGNVIFQIPKCDITENVIKTKLETVTYAIPRDIPEKIDDITTDKLFIKSQISKNISNANCTPRNGEIFTPLQKELFSVINNYQDLYFPNRTFDNADELRFVYCLHTVNHILKTRIKVLHHNSKLSEKDDVPEEFRDQGLVRPKVLIVVPFKSSAYKIVNTIINIMFKDDKGNVSKKNRFLEDYSGNTLSFPKKNPKPEDHEKTFCGNIGDDFKIGISVTKKSLKLYSDFYSSDILVASPLGLRTIIGAEGEPDRDFDFLTSIELLIFDQTEIFLMQNWHHILHLFNHMHLKPKNLRATDLSRVRQWCLNLWAKYYRQTLIFSSITVAEINSIFNKKCFNYAGKAQVSNPVEIGYMPSVYVQLPHVFHKFEANSPLDAIEARFNFFINKILPKYKDEIMKQTLIFIQSYYDYVRIRNYFKKEDISFTQICEYSEVGKVARARDMFYHGDAHFLLYTERFHFYNRIRVKGIRHIIFYQPPNFPNFYPEMCNLMEEINMNKQVGSIINMTISVIYSKYDILQLAAIVSNERAAKMVQSDRKVHVIAGSD